MATMARQEHVHLYEAFLLLVLRDEKGVIDWRAGMWQYGLGGALLAELALSERVTLTDDKRPFLEVRSHAPLGDDVLDECLDLVAKARRRGRAETWVSRFAGLRRLKQRAAASLCRRGILKAEEEQILLIFRRTVYPQMDPGPERRIVERMRRAIAGEDVEVDATTGVLIALLHAIDGLKIHFDSTLLRANKRRIKEIADGTRLASVSRAALEAARAATAACMCAITAATAASAACS